MVDDLDAQLAAVGAVVVEDRALRRVIKHHRGLPGIGLQVPHADSYALSRSALAELEPQVAAIAGLPDEVVAFRGDRGALASGSADAWTAAWRAIFHGRVHAMFDARVGTERALTAAAIHERVHRIGETEFDEIRVVLRAEDTLLPPDDDLTTYVEFVALYLELKHFAPREIARMFPTLHHSTHVDATIALDLDDAALLATSRPAAAPERPELENHASAVRTRAPLRVVRDPSVRPAADAARAKGNHARAAILALRAGDDDAARADLDALTSRLAAALGGVPAETWTAALLPVARYAAGQRVVRYTAGARLLHDLQSAVVDWGREDRVVDVVTWAMSLGKQPVVRALPAMREIRLAKHVHSANKKIAEVGLVSSDEREQLATAVHDMVEHADHQVRHVLRPKIEAALDEVDLRPGNLPERVAQKKLVDELLDRAVDVGRLSLGNLRDALSHNDLKMRDLRAEHLVRGDQLLRADKILATTLDGVYRRGEIYLRGLQKLSSILFGTPIGRGVSMYVLLPAIAAYVSVIGIEHLGGAIIHLTTGIELELADPMPTYVSVGIFVFLLLHVTAVRRGSLIALRMTGRGLRLILFDLPLAIWRLPAVRFVVRSKVARYALEPAIPAVIAVLLFGGDIRWPLAIAVFAVVALVINSQRGRLAWELLSDWLVMSSRHVARRLLPGVIKLIIDVFARLIELFDRALYRVDEFFRFRAGQSPVTIVLKGVFGTLWFFLTYLLRMFVNLMFEPVVNPVKHFPVVTVAAKVTLPFMRPLLDAMTPPLSAALGATLGRGLAGFMLFMIPGVAGFLVWELKENWKLYAATRPDELRAVGFGHHGETMTSLLRPGFHSGTIPKLYAKLRRSARKSDERGVAKHREALHHVEEAIAKFAERELVAMLDEATPFHATDVAVAHVELASNRAQIALAAPSVGDEPATIAFEEQSGWLLASVPVRGWIAQLPADQRAIFEIALAGFYKLAGVDVVREQLEDVLRGTSGRVPAYDVSREGLVAWPGPGYAAEIVYDLHARQLAPAMRGEMITGLEAPMLEGRSALFGREPLRWTAWTTAWQLLSAGGEPPRVMPGPSLVPPGPA